MIGCILEEYATISTDLVDRLYDQNAGKEIPEMFHRVYAQHRLRNLTYPARSFLVQSIDGKPRRTPLAAASLKGCSRQDLQTKDLAGSLFQIDGKKQTELHFDKDFAASLFVGGGRGNVFIGEEREFRNANPPAIPVSSGDILLIPAGMSYRVTNESADILRVSVQRIRVDVAFPPDLDKIS